MALRISRNRSAVHALEREAAYKEFLHRAAEAAAEEAKHFAPVRTGAYRDSIKADGPFVLTTDFKGNWIEFGTKDLPPHAPLRRGAEAAGLRLGESRRK